METTLDVLYHALTVALTAGEISPEQYADALALLDSLKG